MSTKVRYSTRQIMAGFGVSDMTVWTWRQGTAQKEALPTEQQGRNVYFPHGSTVAWAKKHGLAFDAKKAEAALTAPKSGPKPVAKKVPVKKSATAVKASAKKVPKTKRAALSNKTTAGPVAAHV